MFFSLSSGEEGDNSEAETDKKNKREEKEDDDDEEEEMDKKLAELKAEEVADLKRLDSFVKPFFFVCKFSLFTVLMDFGSSSERRGSC